MQDPAELWNSEHLQAAELLAAFLQKQEPNCLIRNTCSAIPCPAAAWAGIQRAVPPAPEPAPAPQKSKHVAAMEQKIGAVMAGACLSCHCQAAEGCDESVWLPWSRMPELARRACACLRVPTTAASTTALPAWRWSLHRTTKACQCQGRQRMTATERAAGPCRAELQAQRAACRCKQAARQQLTGGQNTAPLCSQACFRVSSGAAALDHASQQMGDRVLVWRLRGWLAGRRAVLLASPSPVSLCEPQADSASGSVGGAAALKAAFSKAKPAAGRSTPGAAKAKAAPAAKRSAPVKVGSQRAS